MPTVKLTSRAWFIPTFLLLTALLVYANSFPGAFILDDHIIVEENLLVRDADLVAIFTSDYWHGVENSGLFRPLTILSLAVNRLLTGPAPWGFHLVNLLLHAAAAFLLWRVLLARAMPVPGATAAALLFAVHPLHVEVVNVVVGRSELLVAVFLLAGFLVARRSGVAASLLVAACYLLALLSKEHAITFLILLPLLDLHEHGRAAWPRRWRLYAGLLAVTGGWLCWRAFGVVNPLPPFALTEAAAPLAFVPPLTRILTALQLQGLYLLKLLAPLGLQTVYSPADLPPFVTSPWSLAGMAVLLGTAGTALLLWRGWRRRNAAALFALCYLVAFLPTANLVMAIGVSFAERLSYFPSVWFCAALGALFAALAGNGRWRSGAVVAGVLYLALLGGMTLARNRAYADELSLWTAEAAQNPRDYLAWESLAQLSARRQRPAEAEQAFRRMLELAPDYQGGLRSYTDYLARQGRFAEALVHAQRSFALSVAQADPMAMAFDGEDLADLLLGMDLCTDSLALLDGPVRPLQSLRTMQLRGGALSCLGRDGDAVAVFAVIDDHLLTPPYRYRFALSLYRLGRLADARGQLEKSVAGQPAGESWNLLGAVCAELGDWPAALAAFDAAVAAEPDNARYRENLARARRMGGG